jgi:chemotaxis protein CheD
MAINPLIVDIADMKASDNPEAALITYSLGSCLGVSIYDPEVRVGGLAHFMLPLSTLDSEKAKTRPFMYVDIGMVLFLEQMFRMGARKERCIVKVAGGSQLLDTNDIFRIGQRNHTVLRKILWKNGMLLKGEDVGGALSRTMRLELSDGRVTIKAHGETREL